ncbi:DUF4190 domain-containing protein [Streptomyces sp. NPDC029674]|uniref:DUF4190 domain-containing protein n=1 Tax=Streptomyces sp. NPDC029674 TaxID=3365297 RepID=UPI00384F5BF4
MSAESESDAVSGAGGAGAAPEERDPWAPPPEDAVPPAERWGPASAHDQWAAAASAPRAVPPSPPPFSSPSPPPPAGGAQPFAAPGEPVPPPPLSPDGPGQPQPQPPYGYPGYGGSGYAGQQGYPGYAGYPGYPGGQGAPGYGWPAMPMAPANGMGVAGLVLGIIATVGFCLWPLAIVLGILAVIFGSLGRGKARRGEATNGGQALAGIICGAVGIVLSVALLVVLLVMPDEDSDAGSSPDDAGYSAVFAPSA